MRLCESLEYPLCVCAAGAIVDSIKEFVGFGSEDEDYFNFGRSRGFVNVSTLESFVRGNVIEQTRVAQADDGRSVSR
jgi:hypothetical protein